MAIIRTRKAVYVTLILILGIVCVFGILWFIPKWQVDTYISSGDFQEKKEPIELENDTRRTWAQILGGAFFLITAYFTWRNLQIAKEGQITERFTKAIDQLGDKEHLEVRLGGIYALERIARDSKKDHSTIMEVLSAYVRVNAPWKGNAEQVKEKRMSEGKKSKESQESSQTLTDISIHPADIKIILSVLGRRTLSYDVREEYHIDLRETDLRKMHLDETNLDRTILTGANLSGAKLSNASLRKANLRDADLSDAILEYTNLWGSSLADANLRNANLFGANLRMTYLKGANLRNADLTFADLRRVADISDADLQGAKLYRANLQGVIGLSIKQLSNAKTLYEAKLDQELLEQIKKKHPHLLEEPKQKKKKKRKTIEPTESQRP